MRLKSKNKNGFTLIELMVSVSIFLIVAFVVTSVFITALDAYRKAKQISFLVDNLNFSFDRMVINLREGTNYSVVGSGNTVNFKDMAKVDHSYNLTAIGGSIQECINTTNCTSLTDSKIGIDSLNFTSFPAVGSRPAMIRINARGSITQRNMTTKINLQTTVTQRNTE